MEYPFHRVSVEILVHSIEPQLRVEISALQVGVVLPALGGKSRSSWSSPGYIEFKDSLSLKEKD